MKKICLVISLWIISVYTASAAYPTVEGLFRNGDNKDLIGDYVVVKMIIQEVQNEEILRRIKVGTGDELVANVLTHERSKPQYIKLIYSIEGEARADLLKLEYNDSKMKKASLKKAQLIKGVRRLMKKDEDYERAFFNSLLVMLFLNESKDIMAVLQNLGVTIPTNPMMMNQEKIALLNEYKKYLMAIKEDSSLQEELISPLKPINEDEKLRVEDLTKTSMYKKSENLVLVKENHRFFWKLSYGNFEAYFRNEKHRLDRAKLDLNGKSLTINCGEYVLFNGVHELPTQMLVKDTKERVYKIKMLSLSNFVNSGKSLNDRYRDYKKFEEEVEKKAKVYSAEDVPSKLEENFSLLY